MIFLSFIVVVRVTKEAGEGIPYLKQCGLAWLRVWLYVQYIPFEWTRMI